MAGNTAVVRRQTASDCIEGVKGCGRKSYRAQLQYRSEFAADAYDGCVAARKRLSLCCAVARQQLRGKAECRPKPDHWQLGADDPVEFRSSNERYSLGDSATCSAAEADDRAESIVRSCDDQAVESKRFRDVYPCDGSAIRDAWNIGGAVDASGVRRE